MEKQRIKTYEIIDGVARVSGFIGIEPKEPLRLWTEDGKERVLTEIFNNPLFADIKIK